MSELTNYSIETDHTVLLAFKDGRHLRVPVGQLPHHLASPDLEKVRAALRLRRDFIRRHMPRAALVLIGGGLIALLAMGGQKVAEMIVAPRALPASPNHTGIVRSEELPTPMTTAVPQTGSGNLAGAAGSGPASVIRQALHKRIFPVRKIIKPAPVVLPSPLVSPVPSVTPSPTASPSLPAANLTGSQPVSLPSPTPTPQVPPQGNVLGDSTSATPRNP